MRSPTLPHPHHSNVGARPARESRAGPAPTRLPGSAVFLPVADLVRDSRISRRGSWMISAPTLPHPHHSNVGARPAREIAGRARSYRLPESTAFLPVGADLVRDSRRYRRGSRMRSAPTLPHPHHSNVGARPAREIAGRARSYRLAPNLQPTPNGPLSLRERAGVRERSQPDTQQPPAAPFAGRARSYAAPPAPFHVGARPAREIAGRARSYRLPGSAVFLPVGADLVRDSRISRRGSRMRSAPTLPHPHHSM